MRTGTGLIQPYYGQALETARARHQLGRVAPDPLFPKHAFVAIGAGGRRRVSLAVWVSQCMRREVRAVAYGDVTKRQDAPTAGLEEWLRAAACWLPSTTVHLLGLDHPQAAKVVEAARRRMEAHGATVEVHAAVTVAARLRRIDAGLRLFPHVCIDPVCCAEGLSALEWYRPLADEYGEPRPEPSSDWASLGGDAFGLMCEVFAAQMAADPFYAPLDYSAMDSRKLSP